MIPEHFFDGEELSPKDAERRLLDACDSHEDESYYRKLMPEEITERKSEMAQLDIKHEDLAEAKKKAMAEYKGKMTPLAQQKKKVLGEVRSGLTLEEGEVYTILFAEDRKAATYDRTGRKLSERSMTPEERQQNIRFDMSVNRTGTHD